MRVVVETTGTVEASVPLNFGLFSQLTVDIKGASAGRIASNVVLDGNIASNLSMKRVTAFSVDFGRMSRQSDI